MQINTRVMLFRWRTCITAPEIEAVRRCLKFAACSRSSVAAGSMEALARPSFMAHRDGAEDGTGRGGTGGGPMGWAHRSAASPPPSRPFAANCRRRRPRLCLGWAHIVSISVSLCRGITHSRMAGMVLVDCGPVTSEDMYADERCQHELLEKTKRFLKRQNEWLICAHAIEGLFSLYCFSIKVKKLSCISLLMQYCANSVKRWRGMGEC